MITKTGSPRASDLKLRSIVLMQRLILTSQQECSYKAVVCLVIFLTQMIESANLFRTYSVTNGAKSRQCEPCSPL